MGACATIVSAGPFQAEQPIPARALAQSTEINARPTEILAVNIATFGEKCYMAFWARTAGYGFSSPAKIS